MSKLIPCYLVHPPHAISQNKKRVCVVEHQYVCSFSYLYYSHEYKQCCARTRIIPPSRPGTQPRVMLLCGFFWRSNRNHYLLVLVMRAFATSIHIRAYLPLVHYDTYRGTMGIFFYSKYSVLGQNMTPIWKQTLSCQVLFYQPLHT